MYICDNCAPVVTRKVRGNVCPWITDEIKGLMRERDYLHNKAIKSSILNDWKAYRVVWNKVNNRILLAKESYYESQLSENKNNPKGIWKMLRQLIPKKNKVLASSMDMNGQPVSSPAAIADHFNKYFATIGSKLCKMLPSRQTHILYVRRVCLSISISSR